jgi:tripartite ATP-independent transporter DctP family solute receptor
VIKNISKKEGIKNFFTLLQVEHYLRWGGYFCMKKTTLKFLALISLVVFTLGIFAGCGAPKQDQKAPVAKPEEQKARVIRAGIGLNDKHPQYQGLLKFKEIVERETKGKVQVQIFHSGQLGDDRTMMEALQLGTQEMTCPSTAPIANFVPEFSVFDFPFLFPNTAVADKVLDGPIGKELLDKLPKQNMIGLAYWENGFRDLTNSKKEIKTVADLKGLKIRTMENKLHLDAFRLLGANPTPMPFPELFTAMQQKTVDGQENPVATIYLQKFYEVQKYVTDTSHIYSPFVLLMSKKFWDASTPEEQAIFKKAAEEARDYERKLNREANAKYFDELAKAGMTVTKLTPEARAEFVKTVKPVYDTYKEKVGADLLARVLAEIEKAGK